MERSIDGTDEWGGLAFGDAAFGLLSGWSGKHCVALIGRLKQHHSHDFSSHETPADLHAVDFAAGVLPRPARDQTISASHFLSASATVGLRPLSLLPPTHNKQASKQPCVHASLPWTLAASHSRHHTMKNSKKSAPSLRDWPKHSGRETCLREKSMKGKPGMGENEAIPMHQKGRSSLFFSFFFPVDFDSRC